MLFLLFFLSRHSMLGFLLTLDSQFTIDVTLETLLHMGDRRNPGLVMRKLTLLDF